MSISAKEVLLESKRKGINAKDILDKKVRKNVKTLVERYQPRPLWRPLGCLSIYKYFNEECDYFREDRSGEDLFAFCANKKLERYCRKKFSHILGDTFWIGAEVGKCDKSCEYAEYYGKKNKLRWVHIKDFKKFMKNNRNNNGS